jgi:hypothetical protein
VLLTRSLSRRIGMKKSLVALVVLIVSLALVGSAFAFFGLRNRRFQPAAVIPAWGGCPAPAVCVPAPKPPKQIVKKEYITKKIYGMKVICKGKTRGSWAGCGPCPGPPVTWQVKWTVGVQGPPVEAKYVVVKKARLVGVKKPPAKITFGCPF